MFVLVFRPTCLLHEFTAQDNDNMMFLFLWVVLFRWLARGAIAHNILKQLCFFTYLKQVYRLREFINWKITMKITNVHKLEILFKMFAFVRIFMIFLKCPMNLTRFYEFKKVLKNCSQIYLSIEVLTVLVNFNKVQEF